MKFISDRMLGRLSRWLRIFGYDTLEIRKQENEDDMLLELAEKEDRVLISRDSLLIRKAIKKGIRAYPVRSSEIMEQLREMRLEFQLNLEPEMYRCTLCNSIIRKIEPFELEILKPYFDRYYAAQKGYFHILARVFLHTIGTLPEKN